MAIIKQDYSCIFLVHIRQMEQDVEKRPELSCHSPAPWSEPPPPPESALGRAVWQLPVYGDSTLVDQCGGKEYQSSLFSEGTGFR